MRRIMIELVVKSLIALHKKQACVFLENRWEEKSCFTK